MKKLILLLAFVLAFTMLYANERIYTGIITDTMCGADHAHMKIAPDEKCVRDCVNSDPARWKYALLTSDGKVLTLSDQATPARFAAKKVRVTGTLNTKTNILKVTRIEAQ